MDTQDQPTPTPEGQNAKAEPAILRLSAIRASASVANLVLTTPAVLELSQVGLSAAPRADSGLERRMAALEDELRLNHEEHKELRLRSITQQFRIERLEASL